MRVLVICSKRYNGHELWTLLGMLQNAGHTFEVVSTEPIIRDELTLRPNKIDHLVTDILPRDVGDFSGISVVSGNMEDTEAYWTDPHVGMLLQEFRVRDKVISAICCSVPTLGPIIRGIKVSFFPLVRSRLRLEKFGAILRNVSLTVDKKTITAENQMITEMWAEEIIQCLANKDPLYSFVDSGYVPKGRPRRMPQEVQKFLDEKKSDS